MGKYSMKDFKVGDVVYHLSNTKLRMVVIERNESLAELTCRWIDEKGQVQKLSFLAIELGKRSDLDLKIR
jgi:hypothetical protein